MKVTQLDEQTIYDIGHAFGYYDYNGEEGLAAAFPGQEATATYIRGYVRMGLRGGYLHATSERGEGYLIYKRSDEKLRLSAIKPLMQGVFESMNFRQLCRFICILLGTKKGTPALQEQYDKAKKPYIYVGMVCVREPFQGQGYMRKVMQMAFDEGARLGIPVLLDTDAKSKCDKYIHLGMQLTGTHPFGEKGTIYDLAWFPEGKADK